MAAKEIRYPELHTMTLDEVDLLCLWLDEVDRARNAPASEEVELP